MAVIGPRELCLHNTVDFTADILEFSRYLRICKPKDGKSLCFQICGALSVLALTERLIMPGTVQFNDKLGLVTVKVDDIAANNILSAEWDGVFAEKSIPQKMFFLRHVFSQIPRQLC